MPCQCRGCSLAKLSGLPKILVYTWVPCRGTMLIRRDQQLGYDLVLPKSKSVLDAGGRYTVSSGKFIACQRWVQRLILCSFVSVTLGRPLGVDDLDVDVALPAPISDDTLAKLPKDRVEHPDFGEEPHDSTMSGFIALTKLCKIAGRVAQVLYRPLNGRSVSDAGWAMSQQNTINKLDRTLKDWLENDVVSLSNWIRINNSHRNTKTHRPLHDLSSSSRRYFPMLTLRFS